MPTTIPQARVRVHGHGAAIGTIADVPNITHTLFQCTHNSCIFLTPSNQAVDTARALAHYGLPVSG